VFDTLPEIHSLKAKAKKSQEWSTILTTIPHTNLKQFHTAALN